MLSAIRIQGEAAVALALDDAVLGWLVGAAGSGLMSRLRDPVRAAMRKVVQDAVEASVAEVADHLDGDQVKHLRSALLVLNTALNVDGAPVTSEAELRYAVHAWTTALNEAPFGGPGYLTGVGVDPHRLADALADHILAGIHRDACGSGALNDLAGWLWRDGATAQLARIEDKIDTAVSTMEPAGGGLPGGTPDFTGRQQTLDELGERVQAHDPAGIVVAIHAVDGMAGVGKTELALRAAHQHKHRYPDGQYFINLHGYTEGITPISPETALEELLRQAGVPGSAIPADLAGRQARWQALMAGQRAIVLLDNALDAEHVRHLLPGSPACLVLITSRSRMTGLRGVSTLPLDVLPSDEAVELFIRLTGAHRRPAQEAATRVVELVGRLPVAIEAAAGQVQADLSVAELVGDLANAKRDQQIMEDTGPLGAGIRAALDTSLQRLSHGHQEALFALGVLPGPTIGVPQFAAIANPPVEDARQALRALAQRNLVKAARDPAGRPRYEMHDLVREFARQQARSRLPEARRSAAIAQLGAWYGTVLTALGRLWAATDSQPEESDVEGLNLVRASEARAWLVAEQENLLAFAEAATGVPAADVCRRAAQRLHSLGFNTTAGVLFRRAAATYRRFGIRDGEANARLGLGSVAAITSDYRAAGEHLQVAQSIYEEIGDLNGTADAWHWLGEIARSKGDFAVAGEYYRAAQVTFRRTGNQDGEAGAHRGLANLSLLTGDLAAAREQYHAALAISEQADDWHGRATALCGLGWVTKAIGETGTALEHLHAAKAISEQHGNPDGEAEAHRGLGDVAASTGGRSTAVGHYRLALAIYERTGNRSGQAHAHAGLGHLAVVRKDYKTAAERFHEAMVISKQIGERSAEAHARWDLGDVARLSGDYPAAIEHFRAAQGIHEEIGHQIGQAAAQLGLGDIARLSGYYRTAIEHFSVALAIYESTGNRSGKAEALHGLGIVANAQGSKQKARDQWQMALTIYEEIGSPSAASVRDLLNQPDQA
jgi:tetratricopeptide (TPR) repeat protein